MSVPTYIFRELIKDLQSGEKITELQRKHGFELFETIVRLVKYKQGYNFYKYDFKTNTISPIEFLCETVKDNTPVYDMVLKHEDYYTFYQIKNQKNININHELSIENLVMKLSENNYKVDYKIILNDEYESYVNLYKSIDWNKVSLQQQKIILKNYQETYYTQMCQMIEKYDKSCVFLPPRFGKSYLIGKYIQEHEDKECCVFTSYPTECFTVYEQLQLDYNFNFQYQSRQYFQEANYKKKLEEYKDVDILFLDEYHYGGKTDLSQRVLQYLQKISSNKIKFVYVSGTAQSLIQIFRLPYISLSREVFEQIDYPIMEIHLCNFSNEQIQTYKRQTQRKLIREELKKKNIDESMQNTFVYLETDGNSKEQQEVIGLPNVFCESHKVGGTYPQLRNIFVMNQNLGELLVQQIFRCMASIDIDELRNIYIYNVQQIIEIIQYFQRLFNSQKPLREYKEILPKCIKLSDDVDKQIIEYIEHQDFKLSCVTSVNQKYIAEKVLEKFDNILRLQVDKNISEKVQQIQRAVKDLDRDLREVAKTEKINPFIVLIDRVCSYISLCCYTKDKENCYNAEIQDYSLLQLFDLLSDSEKDRLQQIINGMYKIYVVDRDFDFKVRWLCKIFDSQNNSQLIYNYYNKLQLYIATENKIIVYEKFMQQICTTTMYEKKHNAEILTPIKICQDMINNGVKYCKCLWQKLSVLPAIIEPCCGKGAFCVCLYEKLKELGYSEKQILEEILYINDISTFNTFIVQLILNPLNKYTMNVWNENALTGIDYSDFDLVITNPPYNNEQKQGLTNSKSIFYEFMREFKNAKYSVCIVPTKFFTQCQYINARKSFLPYLLDQQMINNAFCFGGGIEIKTSYYIASNTIQNLYKEEEVKNRVLNSENYITTSYFKVKTNDERLHENYYDGDIVCYVSSHKHRDYRMFIDAIEIQREYNFYKVVCIELARNIKWFLLKPDEICNASFIGFKCDSLQEAKKLLQLCEEQSDAIMKRKSSPHIGKDGLMQIHW